MINRKHLGARTAPRRCAIARPATCPRPDQLRADAVAVQQGLQPQSASTPTTSAGPVRAPAAQPPARRAPPPFYIHSPSWRPPAGRGQCGHALGLAEVAAWAGGSAGPAARAGTTAADGNGQLIATAILLATPADWPRRPRHGRFGSREAGYAGRSQHLYSSPQEGRMPTRNSSGRCWLTAWTTRPPAPGWASRPGRLI